MLGRVIFFTLVTTLPMTDFHELLPCSQYSMVTSQLQKKNTSAGVCVGEGLKYPINTHFSENWSVKRFCLEKRDLSVNQWEVG